MTMQNRADGDRSTVVGVFEQRSDAERAVEQLRRAGFRDDEIGYAARDGEPLEGGRALEGTEGGEAGEGAAKGAVGGGIVGGILGALATGLIPGIGPVIAGGLLAGIIGGIAVGAATGGLFGALAGSMGVPEHEARYYDDEFRAGRTVVTVRAGDRYGEARAIMERAGAYDFETRGARAGVGTPTLADTTAGATGPATLDADEQTIALHEERLRPRTELRETGAVGLRKDVVAQEQTLDVPVSREEVLVERHSVEPRPTDRPVGEEQVIEIPVRAERVELGKEAVIYEEVEIGKRVVQETEHVSGTVRREEVHVESEGDVAVHGNMADAVGGTTGFRSWDEVGPSYQQEWERRYGGSGMRWHDVEPYRRYSYEMAHDDRYRGRTWAEAEPELRANYGEWSRGRGYRYDESAWDRFKDQVRSAWAEAPSTAPRR